MVEGWTPEHSHHRGQLVALTQGLLIVETENERWLFPSQRCAWTPPNCKHAARSVGGAAGSMVDLSPEMCRGLPKTPCVFNTSELMFAVVHRMDAWAHVAGMARRTFMRAFSAEAGMSFGRWRQQARLFAALEMLAQRKSVTEVAIAVGYDSVSAFIEMFRTMLGTTPQRYFRGKCS